MESTDVGRMLFIRCMGRNFIVLMLDMGVADAGEKLRWFNEQVAAGIENGAGPGNKPRREYPARSLLQPSF